MENIRLGIAGLGSMGTSHAKQILEGKAPGLTLAAVADPYADLSGYAPGVKTFTSSEEMIRSGEVDAVLIATPHYDHTTLGILALEQGLHVLLEKPISVHKADAERLIAAHKNPRQVFAAMFNVRTEPHYIKLRELIQSGELGEIRRVTWLITTWFRTEAYYQSGGWRATWEGEGGGVLLNQCPHNLDLMSWLFGMPTRVRAFCKFGHFHNIEVEDDVTAVLDYSNGATGVFITSTGEAPGTNRLEIAAERGRVVVEDRAIHFTRNDIPMTEFSRTTEERFGRPSTTEVEVPIEAVAGGGGHLAVIKNFVDAIRNGAKLVAPAEEGIHSVELANAMLMSAFLDQAIDFPMDSAHYETLLKEKIAHSKGKKASANGTPVTAATGDFAQSFNG